MGFGGEFLVFFFFFLWVCLYSIIFYRFCLGGVSYDLSLTSEVVDFALLKSFLFLLFLILWCFVQVEVKSRKVQKMKRHEVLTNGCATWSDIAKRFFYTRILEVLLLQQS